MQLLEKRLKTRYKKAPSTSFYEHIPCNLCGSEDKDERAHLSHMLRLPDGVHVVRCKKCHLYYLSPRPTSEAYKKHYTNTYQYQPESYLGRIKNQEVFFSQRLDEIEAFGLKRGNVLEVGCATGNFLYQAKLRNWHCIGTEISLNLAEYARNHFNLDVFINDDIRDLNFNDDQFDLVYASNIVEHLSDPSSFFIEVNRIIKPNGVLFIEVPNQFRHLREKMKSLAYSVLPEKIADNLLPPPIDSLHHCYFFSSKTMEAMLRKSGFDILSLSTYTPDYFRTPDNLKRWGGMLIFNIIDSISVFVKRGLCIKVYAFNPDAKIE